MTKHTRLTRRGAVYYFLAERRCLLLPLQDSKIPADLIEHYGKREILESLRTSDAREALRQVRSRSLQQEDEFDRIRAGREVSELSVE